MLKKSKNFAGSPYLLSMPYGFFALCIIFSIMTYTHPRDWSELKYGLISQMTCTPKSLSNIADFETLILCISVFSSHMCTNFCKSLVIGIVCMYLVENYILNRNLFSSCRSIAHSLLLSLGLMSREIIKESEDSPWAIPLNT